MGDVRSLHGWDRQTGGPTGAVHCARTPMAMIKAMTREDEKGEKVTGYFLNSGERPGRAGHDFLAEVTGTMPRAAGY